MGQEVKSQRITVYADIGSHSGYHFHTNQNILGLVRAGYYVSVRPTRMVEEFGTKIPQEIRSRLVNRVQPEPWEFIMFPPGYGSVPGKKTLYYTTLESTRLKADAIEQMNYATAIVVPCSWNASCLSGCGVDVPVYVVPEGADPNLFSFSPIPMEGPTVFGCGGRLAIGGTRKGLDLVMDAFQNAFRSTENVRLKVKVFADCKLPMIDDPRIELVKQFLPENRMGSFYRSLTCFVSASSGEGWGLMNHESMACGRPLIGSIYGGQAEYLTRDNGYPIDYEHQPAQGFYSGCGTCAVPSMDSMVKQMQFVHQNRQDVVNRGWKAWNDVRHLTWDNSVKQLVNVMKKVGMVD